MVSIEQVKAALSAGEETNYKKIITQADESVLVTAMESMLSEVSADKRKDVARRIVTKLGVLYETVAQRYVRALHLAFDKYPILYIKTFIEDRDNLIKNVDGTSNVDNATTMLIFLNKHRTNLRGSLRLIKTRENSDDIIVLGDFQDAFNRIFDIAPPDNKDDDAVLGAIVNGIADQFKMFEKKRWEYYMPVALASRILQMITMSADQSFESSKNIHLVLEKIFASTVKNDIKGLSHYLYHFRLLCDKSSGNQVKLEEMLKAHSDQLITLIGNLLSEQRSHSKDVTSRLVIGFEYLALRFKSELPESVKNFVIAENKDHAVTRTSYFEKEVVEYIDTYIEMLNADNMKKDIKVSLERNVRVGGFELDALVTIKSGLKQAMLNVEVDGTPFHSGRTAHNKNSARDNDLMKTNEQIHVVRLSEKNGRINYHDFRNAIETMIDGFSKSTAVPCTNIYRTPSVPIISHSSSNDESSTSVASLSSKTSKPI